MHFHFLTADKNVCFPPLSLSTALPLLSALHFLIYDTRCPSCSSSREWATFPYIIRPTYIYHCVCVHPLWLLLVPLSVPLPHPWSRSPKCSVPFPVADAVAQRVSLPTDTDAATDMDTNTDTDAELLIKWLKVQPLELWLVCAGLDWKLHNWQLRIAHDAVVVVFFLPENCN